jgi:adenylate kinase family enzyme
MISKIHIIGVSGTGKTSLANILSKIMKTKYYELDDIFYKRKLDKVRQIEERKRILNGIVRKKKWVIEGGSISWVGNSLKKSDVIVYLDFPISLIMYRILKRHTIRALNGTKHKGESLSKVFALLKKSYLRKIRKDHPANVERALKSYRKKTIVIKNKNQLNQFLAKIKAQQSL